jgi:hypothetical protein
MYRATFKEMCDNLHPNSKESGQEYASQVEQNKRRKRETLRPVVHWNRICPNNWTPVYGRIWPTDPTMCKGIATRLLHTTYSAECDRTRPSDGLFPLKWDQSYVFGRRVALLLQANLGLC